MDSSFDQKEQIRDAIDIVELVSRYVPSLRRQGRNYVGRCPWHDDSRPSLQVNPDRQTFKCWVCDIGGDVFSFVMKMENVEFREALEMLADMAGVTLPEKKLFRKGPGGTRFSGESGGVSDENNASSGGAFQAEPVSKPVLYRAMDWLSERYHQFFLNDSEAEPARQYIRDRGISDEMIQAFKIGYSPVRAHCLIDLVGGDRNRVRILEAAGVLAQRQEGFFPPTGTGKTLSDPEKDRFYDRFRGRVLFPIRDTADRTIAFGGRILPNSPINSPAKYVNSPETLIFTKSKNLYGLNRARNSIRKKKRVLITEGYTDCLMAHQFGFDETVAALGTALGEGHIRILSRFADRIYLILDGDEAGRKRADEVLGLFVASGADLSILTLPDDNDPCEYLLAHGAEAFEKMIGENAVDAMDHAFRSATAGVDLERDIVGASRALDRLLAIIALFPTKAKSPGDPIRIRMARTIQRLAERFRVSEEEVRRSLKKHRADLARAGSYRRPDEAFASDPNADANAHNNANTDASQPVNSARAGFIWPIPEFRDETDESLTDLTGRFPIDILRNESLLPNQLEREYLEFWFTCPELFDEMSDQIFPADFYSPITRQLCLLGNSLVNHDREPTFERILLRYDNEAMKNFLVGIDESARGKNLPSRMESEESRRALLKELTLGFERQRIALDEPRKLSDLREEDLSDAEKLAKLLEFQRLQQEKQKRIGGAELSDTE